MVVEYKNMEISVINTRNYRNDVSSTTYYWLRLKNTKTGYTTSGIDPYPCHPASLKEDEDWGLKWLLELLHTSEEHKGEKDHDSE